jgi:hypothetical protein
MLDNLAAPVAHAAAAVVVSRRPLQVQFLRPTGSPANTRRQGRGDRNDVSRRSVLRPRAIPRRHSVRSATADLLLRRGHSLAKVREEPVREQRGVRFPALVRVPGPFAHDQPYRHTRVAKPIVQLPRLLQRHR